MCGGVVGKESRDGVVGKGSLARKHLPDFNLIHPGHVDKQIALLTQLYRVIQGFF